ncbi:hypothetical protein [Bacillus altitudinis]|uniref:hypothetical protein n=1 Tax=Bacillus altitudinis TaxID=293387 RepID=UPI00064CC17D|nr:hypothetical protein [Bacillus altitudinis]KLV14955.1 hypothetical protein ABW03_19245 [Bacillus altitudinis]
MEKRVVIIGLFLGPLEMQVLVGTTRSNEESAIFIKKMTGINVADLFKDRLVFRNADLIIKKEQEDHYQFRNEYLEDISWDDAVKIILDDYGDSWPITLEGGYYAYEKYNPFRVC